MSVGDDAFEHLDPLAQLMDFLAELQAFRSVGAIVLAGAAVVGSAVIRLSFRWRQAARRVSAAGAASRKAISPRSIRE